MLAGALSEILAALLSGFAVLIVVASTPEKDKPVGLGCGALILFVVLFVALLHLMAWGKQQSKVNRLASHRRRVAGGRGRLTGSRTAATGEPPGPRRRFGRLPSRPTMGAVVAGRAVPRGRRQGAIRRRLLARRTRPVDAEGHRTGAPSRRGLELQGESTC